MIDIGGEDLIRFVDAEFEDRCQRIYTDLHILELTFFNVWTVFSAMLNVLQSQP
jgi:hypothetical protein